MVINTYYNFLLNVLQIRPTADGKVTEEEIKAIIKEGTEGGEVQRNRTRYC
jgi:putative hemolysin